MNTEDDDRTFFYSDGWTEDGQRVPVTIHHARSSNRGDLKPVKVPPEELGIDFENVLRINLRDVDGHEGRDGEAA